MDASRPLLTRLRAENVRSFATLDLELGPLTVLVGPNGAGKSNVVELLRFLRDASVVGLPEALARQRGWTSFGRSGSDGATFGFELTNNGDSLGYSLDLEYSNSIVYVEDETIHLCGKFVARLSGNGEWNPPSRPGSPPRKVPASWGLALLHAPKGQPSDRNNDGSHGEPASPPSGAARFAGELLRFIGDICVYNPVPVALRDNVQRADANPFLKEDAGNLGAVLLAIRGTPFGDEIDRALALLVDGVTGYTVLQAGSTLVPQILYGPDDARDLGLESDGTIRLVALLAALYQPVSPSLIVLEEPEMGLHPGVLGALAEIIEEASTRMQILVTTHSPDLIDRFDPDVVRIVEKVNGESVVGRVDPEQRDLIHQRLYRPSELMRMEGLVRERE